MEEQVENTNMAENQNDTNVIQAEDQNNTNVMDSEDNQGKNAQVMTSPCTDPQTNRNNKKETPGGTWGWHLLEEQGELSTELKHNKLCRGRGQGQEIRTNPKWPWIT